MQNFESQTKKMNLDTWVDGKNVKKREGGFTLIELLIVIVIIGILATIGFGSFQSSQVKARDASRKSDLKQMGKALEVYYSDKGEYPAGIGGVIYGCGDAVACAWGNVFSDNSGTVYMVELPSDPRSSQDYYYESDGSYYQIYARLENKLDKDLKTNPSDEKLEYSGLLCGDDNCNYGVSSSNYSPDEDRTLVTF